MKKLAVFLIFLIFLLNSVNADVVIGTNAGFVETAPSANPSGTNLATDTVARAIRHTSPLNASKVTEIGIYIDNATQDADMELGIYDHDVGNDRPGNLLGSVTIQKGTSSGWISSAVDIAIGSETIYFIAIQLDDTATTTNTNYTGSGPSNTGHNKSSQTSLPNPWGNDSSGTLIYAVYAVYETTLPPPPPTALENNMDLSKGIMILIVPLAILLLLVREMMFVMQGRKPFDLRVLVVALFAIVAAVVLLGILELF